MLCVLQVMDFLLVVVRLRLIMSGDVELNPGPLDGGWSIKGAYMYVCVGMYNVHIWYKKGRIPYSLTHWTPYQKNILSICNMTTPYIIL